jgi:hypothetical protein
MITLGIYPSRGPVDPKCVIWRLTGRGRVTIRPDFNGCELTIPDDPVSAWIPHKGLGAMADPEAVRDWLVSHGLDDVVIDPEAPHAVRGDLMARIAEADRLAGKAVGGPCPQCGARGTAVRLHHLGCSACRPDVDAARPPPLVTGAYDPTTPSSAAIAEVLIEREAARVAAERAKAAAAPAQLDMFS